MYSPPLAFHPCEEAATIGSPNESLAVPAFPSSLFNVPSFLDQATHRHRLTSYSRKAGKQAEDTSRGPSSNLISGPSDRHRTSVYIQLNIDTNFIKLEQFVSFWPRRSILHTQRAGHEPRPSSQRLPTQQQPQFAFRSDSFTLYSPRRTVFSLEGLHRRPHGCS